MTTMMLWWMLACGTSGADTSPEALAVVAEAIEAEPGRADAILSAAGLSRSEFDAALYDIAMDPDLSKRYLQSRE